MKNDLWNNFIQQGTEVFIGTELKISQNCVIWLKTLSEKYHQLAETSLERLNTSLDGQQKYRTACHAFLDVLANGYNTMHDKNTMGNPVLEKAILNSATIKLEKLRNYNFQNEWDYSMTALCCSDIAEHLHIGCMIKDGVSPIEVKNTIFKMRHNNKTCVDESVLDWIDDTQKTQFKM